MEQVIRITGALAALDQATLAVKVAGHLASLRVDLGSVVRTSEVIAQVESLDFELRVLQADAAVAQARASLGLSPGGTNDTIDIEAISLVREARAILAEAQSNRERTFALTQSQIASAAQMETAEASFTVASNRLVKTWEEARTRQATLAQRRAELAIARQQLADTTLLAPFDGTVQTRHASMGEYVTTGTPIVTLVRTDLLRLRLEVPEREAPAVRAGQMVRFQMEGSTNVHTSVISRLSPAISEQNRMLLVEADVPANGSLRPGSFTRAEIVVNMKDTGLAVPSTAITQFAGLEKVVLARDGKALETVVSTGRRGSDWVEINNGLKADDWVILNPGSLRTGDSVSLPPSQDNTLPLPNR
jgi:RND family efflux transporter MFP subunit